MAHRGSKEGSRATPMLGTSWGYGMLPTTLKGDQLSNASRKLRRKAIGSHLTKVQRPESLIYSTLTDTDVPVLYFGVNDAVHFVDDGHEKAGPYGRQGLPRNQDDVYSLVGEFYTRFGECLACHPPEREQDVGDVPFQLHYDAAAGRLIVTCPQCAADYNSIPAAEAEIRKAFYVEAVDGSRSRLLPFLTAEAPHLRTAVLRIAQCTSGGRPSGTSHSLWVCSHVRLRSSLDRTRPANTMGTSTASSPCVHEPASNAILWTRRFRRPLTGRPPAAYGRQGNERGVLGCPGPSRTLPRHRLRQAQPCDRAAL